MVDRQYAIDLCHLVINLPVSIQFLPFSFAGTLPKLVNRINLICATRKETVL